MHSLMSDSALETLGDELGDTFVDLQLPKIECVAPIVAGPDAAVVPLVGVPVLAQDEAKWFRSRIAKVTSDETASSILWSVNNDPATFAMTANYKVADLRPLLVDDPLVSQGYVELVHEPGKGLGVRALRSIAKGTVFVVPPEHHEYKKATSCGMYQRSLESWRPISDITRL